MPIGGSFAIILRRAPPVCPGVNKQRNLNEVVPLRLDVTIDGEKEHETKVTQPIPAQI